MIQIDMTKCTECNRCFLACPDGNIAKGPVIRPEAPEHCISCGSCYAVCPENAITVVGFEDAEIFSLSRETSPDSASLMALLRGRRSCRSYKPVPVSKEQIEQILDAASVAPSSCNWRFVKAYVYTDEAVISRIREKTTTYYRWLLRLFSLPGFPILARLINLPSGRLEYFKQDFRYRTTTTDRKDPFLYGAKTLVAFTVPKEAFAENGDAWIAAENAVIYAETIGVATCYNGYVSAVANMGSSVRTAMGIPKGESVVCVLKMGYPVLDFERTAPRERMETVWT